MYSGLYFIIISYSEQLDNVSSVKHVGIFVHCRIIRRIHGGQRGASMELRQIVCSPKGACKWNTSLEDLVNNQSV